MVIRNGLFWVIAGFSLREVMKSSTFMALSLLNGWMLKAQKKINVQELVVRIYNQTQKIVCEINI